MSGTRKKILVITKNFTAGQQLKRMIKKLHLEILLIDDHYQALNQLANDCDLNIIGVIIDDSMMVNYQGVEFFRWIKTLSYEVRLMLLTTKPSDYARLDRDITVTTEPLSSEKLMAAFEIKVTFKERVKKKIQTRLTRSRPSRHV